MATDERHMQFGRRLRQLREEKGMSRKQLADKMDLSERAVIQWERGEREPGWFNVLALCEALGVECTTFTVAPSPTPPPAKRTTGEKAKRGTRRRKGG